MTDKMREAIIQFGQDNPSLDLDFRLHTHGKYLTQEKAIVASRAFKAGAAWQAAQAEQAVPVVGDVVYIRKDKLQRVQQFGPSLCEILTTPDEEGLVPLIAQPTHSITAAELERLRKCEKDAERLRDALRYYGTHSNACDMSRFVNPAGCTCGYDAAIAAEGEKE